MKGSREWRVTLATKWAYLDNLAAPAIVERFEETHGIELSEATVYDYLNEQEAEEVEEQIKREHANARLQIAEAQRRKHDRAREAEQRATKREALKRVVPVTKLHVSELGEPKTVQKWEDVESGDDDWPEWAEERDHIIRFVEGETTQIQDGHKYPAKTFDGEMKPDVKLAGLYRDVPDEDSRSRFRQEQLAHFRAMGEVLGVYEETINLEVDEERSIDEEDKAELVEALETLRDGGAPPTPSDNS